MPTIEGQFRVQHSTPDTKGLQEQPQAVALIDAVDEQQYLALHQAQLQNDHYSQQLVFPAGIITGIY